MPDLGWTKYINAIEENNTEICREHRRKMNFVDNHDDSPVASDCCEMPCRYNCPFSVNEDEKDTPKKGKELTEFETFKRELTAEDPEHPPTDEEVMEAMAERDHEDEQYGDEQWDDGE